MVQRARRHMALAGTGAALTIILAGCGEGTNNAAPPPEPPAPTTPPSSTSTTTPPPTSTPPETSTSSSQPPADGGDDQARRCMVDDLDVALGRGTGAAGTAYKPLQFINSGGSPCVLQGYPGVSYVAGGDAHQVGAPAQRTGGDGPAITLAPGETAFASVGFVQVRNYDPAECQPTDVRALRVYPPQETASVLVEYSGTGCASEGIPGDQLTVKAVQPGSGPRS